MERHNTNATPSSTKSPKRTEKIQSDSNGNTRNTIDRTRNKRHKNTYIILYSGNDNT